MISWLEDNLAGKVLAGICAAMIVIALLLGVVWSLPPSADLDEGSEGGQVTSMDVPQLKSGEPIEKFAVITERPVFNASRQPVIVAELDEEGLGDEEESEVDAPEVELAGVVITPSIRMVTLRQKETDESLVAFEGQPLEGSYGSWQVNRIEPRAVTLRSGSGEEVQLELQIHDAVITEPPKMASEEKSAETTPGSNDPGDDQPMSRAEEIRQRIAERREELRRAAEEGGDTEAEVAEKPADYRSAIQAMMGRKNKQANDENEQ